MKRLFQDHIKRKVTYLDGPWRFLTDPDDCGEAENWMQALPGGEITVVPSVWNNELGMAEYEGAVWYEKEFFFAGGAARLVFEAVMTECKVWLNGVFLGSHYGGFCQFDFMVPQLAEGLHRLVLKVDNRFDEHSIPQTKVDWFHCGGITRSVSIEELKGVAITHCACRYELNDAFSAAEVSFDLELYGASAQKETDLKIFLGDTCLFAEKVSLRKGSKKKLTTETIRMESPHLWCPEDPYLYELQVTTDGDDWLDRIGFRRVEVLNRKILLNGAEVTLQGVNRHEDYPGFGFAFPPAMMKRDLDLIQDLGCNALRGSHYPNAQMFVDMLDARGLLFWSEIPIWGCGFSEKALGDPVVVRRGEEMLREMVRYYDNHPSIVIWGIHNEIKTDTPAALRMTKRYYSLMKEIGGNRLVTYASDHPMTDGCMEYCDVISLNQYHGWYYGKREDWPRFLEEFDARRKALGVADKPVLMSEFGGAALYGHHTFDDLKWSEEYQAELLRQALTAFKNCPYVSGSFVWQFCDSSSQKDLAKVRAENNKGILNAYRQPKAAWSAVRSIYKGE